MSNEVDREAMCLWTLPRSAWPAALAAMPAQKYLNGVKWPFREAVRQRLALALQMRKAGCYFSGWPTREPDPNKGE